MSVSISITAHVYTPSFPHFIKFSHNTHFPLSFMLICFLKVRNEVMATDHVVATVARA